MKFKNNMQVYEPMYTPSQAASMLRKDNRIKSVTRNLLTGKWIIKTEILKVQEHCRATNYEHIKEFIGRPFGSYTITINTKCGKTTAIKRNEGNIYGGHCDSRPGVHPHHLNGREL